METWTQAIARLEQRIDELEARLDGKPRPARTEPIRASEPGRVASPPRPVARVPEAPREPTDISRVLGVLASLCFVLAALFLVKLSLDAGWLTPWRQVALASAFGVFLIAAGAKLAAKDAAYASFLPAAGIAILYMAAALGFFVHALYPPEVCILLTNALSVLCLAVPHRLRVSAVAKETYGVVAVIGAYGSVSCFQRSYWDISLLTALFFSWGVAFSALSVFLKNRSIALVAAYLGIALYHTLHISLWNDIFYQMEAVFQFVQLLVFASSVVWYSKKNGTPLTLAQAWAYFPVLLFFYCIEYSLVHRMAPDLAPSIALASVAVIAALYQLARRGKPAGLASGSVVALYSGMVLFHAVYLELLNDRGRAWAGPVLLAAAALGARRFDPFRRHFGATFFFVLALLGSLGTVVFRAGGLPLGEAALLHGLTWLIAAGAYLKAGRPGADDESAAATFTWILLALAHFQFVIGAARGIAWGRDLIRSDGALFPFVLSCAWGLYALAVLGFSRAKKDKTLALSSLVVLLIAVVKLFLFDVGDLSAIVRVLCFLAMGAILYLCGYVLKNVNRW